MGTDIVDQGYPETLRLAHIFSTFTADQHPSHASLRNGALRCTISSQSRLETLPLRTLWHGLGGVPLKILRKEGDDINLLCFPDEEVDKGDYLLVTDKVKGRSLIVQVIDTSHVEDEIQKYVRQKLAVHAAPREIEFKQKLPKTRSGKIMRRVFVRRGNSLADG